MKPKRAKTSQAIVPASRSFDGLVLELRTFITESRRQIIRAVDFAQVQTCWGVGRHIVEFEQGGAAKATYGAKLLPRLAEALTADFGKGFDASNLRYMRQFYLAFPICDTVCHKLSWSHYRKLLRVEDSKARDWYIEESVTQNWSIRALDREISRLYYERLLSSRDKKAVRAEAEEKIAELPPSPRDFVRDPVLLEFLGLPETGRLLKTNLEQGLIDHLQASRAQRLGLRQPAAAFRRQPAAVGVLPASLRQTALASAKPTTLFQLSRPATPAGWLDKAAAGCRSPKRFAPRSVDLN